MDVQHRTRPIHPGEVLARRLDDLDLTIKAFAGELAVPVSRVSAILKGRGRINADTALRLARYFGTTPEFWVYLQQTYELRVAELEAGEEINAQVQPRACLDPSR